MTGEGSKKTHSNHRPPPAPAKRDGTKSRRVLRYRDVAASRPANRPRVQRYDTKKARPL